MLIFESTYLDDFNIWGPSAVALLIDLSLTIELLFLSFFFFCGLSLHGFACTANCVKEVRYQGKYYLHKGYTSFLFGLPLQLSW